MPESDFDPRCTGCDHGESLHRKGYACEGTSGAYGHRCTCSGFIRPSPRQERTQRNNSRSRFNMTSGRNEIGTGGGAPAPLFQSSSLTNLPGGRGQARTETPEWVMFGVRQQDGSVVIYASTKLSYVSMRQEAPGEFEKMHADLINKGTLSDKPWSLSGRMVGYIQSKASNYTDALRALVTKGWKPDPDAEPTTEEMQRRAALEDMQREQEREREREKHQAEQRERERLRREAEVVDDEIYEAEIVEDDDV